MSHRVARKGQIVIPKAFRKAIRLEPGDEVTFSREGSVIRVERVASPDALMGCLAGHKLVGSPGEGPSGSPAARRVRQVMRLGQALTRSHTSRPVGCRVEDLRA